MYIARKKIEGKTHYVLRHSYPAGETMSSRDLYELGTDPSRFIVYPGGNAYYVDDIIETALNRAGVTADADTLEDLFWPFMRPDIKHAVDYFRHREGRSSDRKKLSATQEATIRKQVPAFDKRRMHFLKYGNMEQGPISRMPPVLFRHLVGKSRDEIEQYFMGQERGLKASEQKTYTYVALDLQRFFPNILAVKMPQALDQVRVDQYFMEQICHANRVLFNRTSSTGNQLHEYLIRYLIMFFDNEYEHSELLDDYVKDFMYRHRFHRPPPPENTVSIDTACRILGISKEHLKTITRKGLTRRYRKLAQQCHPDTGGSNEKFVELTDAYKGLLRKIKTN